MALAALVAGGTTMPAAAESTGAAAAPRGCYRKYVCFWTGINFVGGPWNTNPVPLGECRPLDHASSAYNNSESWARFREFSHESPDGGYRCRGKNKLLRPGQRTSNMGFDAHGLGGR